MVSGPSDNPPSTPSPKPPPQLTDDEREALVLDGCEIYEQGQNLRTMKEQLVRQAEELDRLAQINNERGDKYAAHLKTLALEDHNFILASVLIRQKAKNQ